MQTEIFEGGASALGGCTRCRLHDPRFQHGLTTSIHVLYGTSRRLAISHGKQAFCGVEAFFRAWTESPDTQISSVLRWQHQVLKGFIRLGFV